MEWLWTVAVCIQTDIYGHGEGERLSSSVSSVVTALYKFYYYYLLGMLKINRLID